MKYLAVGDIHIDLSNRMYDIQRALLQIANLAVFKGVDKVLFLGDAFTSRRPYPEEYNVLYEWVADLVKNNIEVVILKGNHDIQRDASTLDVFDKLKPLAGGLDKVRVVESGHIEDGWIFMGHFILKEAAVGPANIHIANSVTTEQLLARYPSAKLFLLGDIHKPQQLNENPPVYYLGSIERNNFGERENEPRVLFITNDQQSAHIQGEADKEFYIESIPLRVRPMIQVNLSVKDDILSGAYKSFPKNFSEALVKVVLSGTDEELALVDMTILREFFSGAHSLMVQYDVARKGLVRDINSAVAVSEVDALYNYIYVKREDLTAPIRERALVVGKEIITKTKENV